MIEGRIIRILDDRRVVLNVGTAHGVKRGTNFGIYTPVDEIKDPKTGEVLGNYRRRKATVRVTEAYERFCVASPPGRRRVTVREEPQGFGISAILGSRASSRVEEVPVTLDVEYGEEEPLPTGDTIRRGDVVESDDDAPA